MGVISIRHSNRSQMAVDFKAIWVNLEWRRQPRQEMASVRKRSWTTPKGEPRSLWIVDFIDTNGNRDLRLFKTKRDADTFRIKVEGQLTAGMFRPDAAKTSVAGAAADFL